MKILLVGPANPYRGGIAALNERLALQLMSEQHEVQLINFSVQYPSFLFPGKTQYTDTLPPKELTIRRMINSVNPFNWLIAGLKLKKEKADLILVRFWLPFMAPSTGTICGIAKRNKHTKIIAMSTSDTPRKTHR
jgi:hypothetical protein